MAKAQRPSWPQPIIKALYGRAANRCSICNCFITELPETVGDRIVVLGEIAHINGISSDGPRGNKTLTKKERNDYLNLILLCANCHKRIDRKEITYTVQELKRLKAEHETHNERFSARLTSKKAVKILDTYVSEFQSAYKLEAWRFVLSGYKIGDTLFPEASEVPYEALEQGAIILGGSGFGKSLLARHLAIHCIEKNEIPIIVEVIQFSKNIEPRFDRQQGIISSAFEEVELACSVLGKKVLLVVDGYNECPEAIRIKLNLWIIRFLNTFSARLLLTSQTEVTGLQGLNLLTIELLPPTKEGKLRIASGVNDKLEIDKVEMLLDAISTGLEARLIGEVAQRISPAASRYAVYDSYSRERLDEQAEVGITVLAAIAELLYKRITFSLSQRDLGRLLSNKNINLPSQDFLFKSGLLSKREDRVFFKHELFFNAFSAEAIVRAAAGDPRTILVSLAEPRHREQREFILGAIDDQSLLDQLLPQINDFDLIALCLAGDCGIYAKEWADNECRLLFKKIENEIRNLSFKIAGRKGQDGGTYWSVSIDESSTYKWSEQERCFIHALPLSIFKGKHVTDIFDLVGAMDKRLSQEFTRLRSLAIEKKINLRSTMFEEIYHGWSVPEVSMRMILKNFISGGWSSEQIQPSEVLLKFCRGLLALGKVSDGQLFLLIHLIQKFRWSYPAWKSVLTRYLPYLLKERWKYSPHQLRMSLLDVAHYSWDADQVLKDQITEQLNHLLEVSREDWLMPTFIIDALKGLGALENDEVAYEETVRDELAAIFRGKENSKKCAAAYGFHTRTFDHPYEKAYWQVISELSETDAKRLYTMALKGAAGKSSFGIPLLLYNVAKYEDLSTADAIRPFTKIPPTDDSMPQSSTEACLLAHIALGWIGASITTQLNKKISNTAKAFLAYAEVMYWTNRRDLAIEERSRGMEEAWKILHNYKLGASVDALRNFNGIVNESMGHFAKDKNVIVSMQKAYPNEVAEICRQGLIHAQIQIGYFKWEKNEEIINHAIHLLGYFGNSTDLSLLKTYTIHPKLGKSALKAIERIESRHTS